MTDDTKGLLLFCAAQGAIVFATLGALYLILGRL